MGASEGVTTVTKGWQRVRRRVALLIAALSFASAAGAQTTMVFADGAGEVTLPKNYQRVEDSEASLVAVSLPQGNVRLYFDLHKLDELRSIERPAEVFVREQAEKKKVEAVEIGDKVGLFEPGPDTIRAGRRYINLHWLVGFGDTLVLMSAFIPRDASQADDVRHFLSDDLRNIIETVRRMRGSAAGEDPDLTAHLQMH